MTEQTRLGNDIILLPNLPEVNLQLGIPDGNYIRLAYSHPYWRCGWGTWSTRKLLSEIQDGYWILPVSIPEDAIILNELPSDAQIIQWEVL